ncbi:GFA family protein [Ciceribacter sp. L1K23]|uniref:GFA family protein n=1 Tax=Ciceribacter sp. L1K23 TaxID=2820276 RepID=UPI001B82109F|nr:GFA family protein [Ciceribacter sp. L1K23]MBR0555384.1 GFA family protein [Ciceribacter sp. L1K23]
MTELSGRCLCGSVRLSVSGPVLNANHCHCESCRRATSSGVASFFTVARTDVELSGASLRRFVSSPGVTRGFCGTCGSPMSYETERRPAEIDLYIACLDDPSAIVPKAHDFWSERVGWLHVVDGLPKNEH